MRSRGTWTVVACALAFGSLVGCGGGHSWAAFCDPAYASLDELAMPGDSRANAATGLADIAPSSARRHLEVLLEESSDQPLGVLSARTQQARALEDLYGELARHCEEAS